MHPQTGRCDFQRRKSADKHTHTHRQKITHSTAVRQRLDRQSRRDRKHSVMLRTAVDLGPLGNESAHLCTASILLDLHYVALLHHLAKSGRREGSSKRTRLADSDPLHSHRSKITATQ